MYNTTKLGMVTLALVSAMPAQATTAMRQIESIMRTETGQSGSPLFKSYYKGSYANLTDPVPTSRTNFNYTKYVSNTSDYRSYWQLRCFESNPTNPFCTSPEARLSGFASAYVTASVGTGVMKATTTSYIDMESPTYESQFSEVINDLRATSADRITFNGIAPGDSALVKITNFAAVDITLNNILIDPVAQRYNANSFEYRTSSLIYDNDAALRSLRPVAKLSSSWRVCSNSQIQNACGINTISSGFLQTSNLFFVDSDDILILNNSLQMTNTIAVQYSMFDWADRSIMRQKNNFGNSGYTLIEMLTPGTSYTSESGNLYPTSVPAPVPEPASWAMLIAGFGMTGGAMRRRRQRPHSVAA